MGKLLWVGIGIGILAAVFFGFIFMFTVIINEERLDQLEEILEDPKPQVPEKPQAPEKPPVPETPDPLTREFSANELSNLRVEHMQIMRLLDILLRSCENVDSADDYSIFKAVNTNYDIDKKYMDDLMAEMSDRGFHEHPQVGYMLDDLDEGLLEVDTCMQALDLKYS